MACIKIEWLRDSYECDDCGISVSDGAIVRVDGEQIIELTPIAHCYDGQTYDRDDIYRAVLRYFGRWTTVEDPEELRQQLVNLGHELSETPYRDG